jgi:hypothetical protein
MAKSKVGSFSFGANVKPKKPKGTPRSKPSGKKGGKSFARIYGS